MDQPWVSPLVPSQIFTEDEIKERKELITVEKLKQWEKELRGHTCYLNSNHNDIRRRLDRAGTLLEIGFPELACCDAFKALGQLDQRQETDLLKTYLVLIRSLRASCDPINALRFIITVEIKIKPTKIPTELTGQKKTLIAQIKSAKELQATPLTRGFAEEWERKENPLCCFRGQVYDVTYPWVVGKRSARVMEDMGQWISGLSLGNFKLEEICIGKHKCYGMFAAKDLESLQLLGTSPSIYKAHNAPRGTHCYNCGIELRLSEEWLSFPCCKARGIKFCGANCQNIAEDCYHSTLCKLDKWYPRYLDLLPEDAEVPDDLIRKLLNGIYGLVRYPGDDFPGRVEMTVDRANVNLSPLQARKDQP